MEVGFQSIEGESVVMRERSTLDIPPDRWRRLAASPKFWKLVADGIVNVQVAPSGGAKILSFGWIGRAFIGDYLFEITEKVSGSAMVLLDHLWTRDVRSPRVDGIVGRDPVGIARIVERFVILVTSFVSRGLLRAYSSELRRSPLACGKLRLPETLRLRASGMGHILVTEQPKLSTRVDINTAIALALTEVERLAKVGLIPEVLVGQVRRLAMLFGEARDHRISSLNRRGRIAWIERVRTNCGISQAQVILDFALLILARGGFMGEADGRAADCSYFLNLELPFERAVRHCLRGAGHVVSVVDGRRRPASLASDTSEFKANPDFVLNLDSSEVVIGDAKYKEASLDLRPEPADLYQLLCHATAYTARTAFLLYPGESYRMKKLGNFRAGVAVFIGTLSVTSLEIDCHRFIEDITGHGVCR
jgi:hypothetical protein